MNINEILQDYRFEVETLLRRYRVIGGANIETIKKAHNKFGDEFMLRLLEIITPDDDSFTSLISPDNEFMQDAFKYAASQQPQEEPKTGKFWSFWENLLNKVGETGETVRDFKYNVNNPDEQYKYQYAQQMAADQARQKTIFIIAGALIAVVVAILLIKK